MAARRLLAVLAVAPVLPGELAQRVARDVAGGHLGQADDPPAASADARGQLAVLVDRPALVPAALGEHRVALPDAGEAAVDLDLVRRAAEARAADAHRRLERERHAPGPCVGPLGDLRPADVRDVAAAEPRDAGGEVVVRVPGVRVHPRDVAPAGGVEADVQRVRRVPCGVVEEAHAGVLRRDALDDRAARVGGPAVHDEDLEVARHLLGAHQLERALEVALLVEHRHEDRDGRFALGHACSVHSVNTSSDQSWRLRSARAERWSSSSFATGSGWK
jgi:hypothetical protein